MNAGPFVLHVELWPGAVPEALDSFVAIKDQDATGKRDECLIGRFMSQSETLRWLPAGCLTYC